MPRVCTVTGKKTEVGMNVSHSMRHTKRTFLPNLQKLKFHSDILDRDFALRISTAGLRTLTKHGANRHSLQNLILSQARLPIPPRGQNRAIISRPLSWLLLF